MSVTRKSAAAKNATAKKSPVARSPRATAKAKVAPAPTRRATGAKATPREKAKANAPKPVASGPRPETLAFAKKVVALRDQKKMAWKAVASALDVPYDQNGSSRLRRAYILGKGKTVGVRAAK